MLPGGVTLYAQWVEDDKQVLTFNKNSVDATGSMPTIDKHPGEVFDLPSNGFTRPNYTFVGWNTSADGSGDSYSDGQTDFTMLPGGVTLYAQWTKDEVTKAPAPILIPVTHYHDVSKLTGTFGEDVSAMLPPDAVILKITMTSFGDDNGIIDTTSGSAIKIAGNNVSYGLSGAGSVGDSAKASFNIEMANYEDATLLLNVVLTGNNDDEDEGDWVSVDDDEPGDDEPGDDQPTAEPEATESVEETSYPVPSIFTRDHIAYVTGYPDGSVRPLANITRAEVSTIFFRLLIDQVRADNWTQQNDYSDVTLSDWYNNAVSVMSKLNKVLGYPTGEFKADTPITRAELAAIVSRFAEEVGEASTAAKLFNDTATHWGENQIAKAAGIGWLKGYPDGSFKPDQYTTRAEFITVVNRILHREPENLAALHAAMNTWSDNMNQHAWYYLAIQEASNSHNHKTVEKLVPNFGFKYEVWTQLTPNRDWTQLEKEWSSLH